MGQKEEDVLEIRTYGNPSLTAICRRRRYFIISIHSPTYSDPLRRRISAFPLYQNPDSSYGECLLRFWPLLLLDPLLAIVLQCSASDVLDIPLSERIRYWPPS